MYITGFYYRDRRAWNGCRINSALGEFLQHPALSFGFRNRRGPAEKVDAGNGKCTRTAKCPTTPYGRHSGSGILLLNNGKQVVRVFVLIHRWTRYGAFSQIQKERSWWTTWTRWGAITRQFQVEISSLSVSKRYESPTIANSWIASGKSTFMSSTPPGVAVIKLSRLFLRNELSRCIHRVTQQFWL